MKFKLLFLCVFAFFAVNSYSVVWEIKQDGSGDFTTIQEGIDVAPGQDTVLVYPGTYYENLEIILQGQILGSLYLTTSDESYIAQTIIDGNFESSVIRIDNNVSYGDVKISGFTIQHGIGYLYNEPDRAGGGIFAWESDLTIEKCIIQYNYANNAGGGIAIAYSYLDLFSNTIRFNKCSKGAGGLLIGNTSSVNFDSDELNSIYLNYAGIGNDIFIANNAPFQEIILDTFTVMSPDDNYYFIYPGSGGTGIPLPDHYSIDIQHGYIEQADQDIYVAPNGDNNNSGLTVSDPLQTISYALVKINADSLYQRTIHIADGTYSVSQNNQVLPMQIKSHINIVGESMENTILDAENQYGFFYIASGQTNFTINNFSLLRNHDFLNIKMVHATDAYIKNIYAADGFCQVLFSNQSDVTLENVTQVHTTGGQIYYNSSHSTGIFNMIDCRIINNYGNTPIFCYQASNTIIDSLTVNIVNAEVTDNLEIGSEWLPRTCAIMIDYATKMNLINSTIGNNESLHNGAAVQLAMCSQANIVNSIIYGNEPYNLCLNGQNGPVTLTTYNSLIEGGEDGQLIYGTNYIDWDDETMLDEDPLWMELGTHSYALSADSPCINTGTLELPFGVELPAYDRAGNPRVMGSNIDMGAYEYPGNAAPIYLQIDNETLSWQMPDGHSPTEYNIYLDDIFQSSQTSFLSSYTFADLVSGDTYKAGVSAVYDEEETAIIPHYFTYQPVEIEEPTMPNSTLLTPNLTNYPNPFNPVAARGGRSSTTTIAFNVSESGKVKLEIFNIKGQRVRTLIDAYLTRGHFKITWNGKNSNNKHVASGEYIAKLKVAGDKIAVKKILVLK